MFILHNIKSTLLANYRIRNILPQGVTSTMSDAPKVTTKKRSHRETTIDLPAGKCALVADRYEKVGRIGEGSYGVVYKAIDRQTNAFVALKRCIPHHESSDGFPVTSECFCLYGCF
jgi:serine/threonine protein kinase